MTLQFKSPMALTLEKPRSPEDGEVEMHASIVCRDIFRKRQNAPNTPTLVAPMVNLPVSLSMRPDSTSQAC